MGKFRRRMAATLGCESRVGDEGMYVVEIM